MALAFFFEGPKHTISMAKTKNTILDKVLDLLSKTKDALVADLENDFVSVKEAIVKFEASANDDETTIATTLLNAFNTHFDIIDAVFAKVGYDISHYENLEDLKSSINKLIELTEGISNDIQKTVNNNDGNIDGDEMAAIIDTVVPRVQEVVDLVREICDIEWEKVLKELNDAEIELGKTAKEKVLNKDFARKILDHILMTLLKNANVVFRDEIEFVKMTVTNQIKFIEKDINNIGETIANDIKTALNGAEENIDIIKATLQETLDDAEHLYKTVSEESKSAVLNFLNELSSNASAEFNNVYGKLARSLSITYAILDFLGILQEKQFTLKLPKKVKLLLKDAQSLIGDAENKITEGVNSLNSKIGNIKNDAESVIEDASDTLKDASANISNLTNSALEAIDDKLKLSKEITGTSLAAVGTLQAQMMTLYGLGNDAKGGLNSIANTLSGKLPGVSGTVSGLASDAVTQLQKISDFEYPIKINVVSWNKLEKLFTDPIHHFKQLYPIDSFEDAQDLMKRIMGILNLINPDIPDFDSLRNLLENLLRQLQQRMMKLLNELKEKAKDAAQEIWDYFHPIINTIRKVIDMLKEMALALKDKMYDVLNDAKAEIHGISQVINTELETLKDNIKETVDDAKNKVANGLEEVYKDIDANATAITETFEKAAEKVDKELQNASTEAQQSLASLEKQTREHADKVVKELTGTIDLPKVNIPKIVKKTVTEPVIDVVQAIIKDVGDFDLNLSSIFELKSEISDFHATLRTINKDYRKIQKLSLADVTAGTDLSMGLVDIKKDFDLGLQLPDIQGIVSEVALPELNAWAYGVVSSIKTVTSVNVWKTRLDTVIAQLQAEFQNDLQNITGLISKDGAMKILNNSGAVASQLKSELNINDYITIVQTAINDVVIPNPELYLTSFKSCLSTIISALIDKILKAYEDIRKQIIALPNVIETNIEKLKVNVTNYITSLGDNISEKAKPYVKDLQNVIEKAQNLIAKIIETVKNIKEQFTEELSKKISDFYNNIGNYLEQLRDALIDRLEDLGNEIWSKVKSEIITPLLNTIKNEILKRIKALIKKALTELINRLSDFKSTVEDKAEEAKDSIGKLLDKLPTLKDLIKAESELAKNFRKLLNESSLKNEIDKIIPNNEITNLGQITQLVAVVQKDESIKHLLNESLHLTLHVGETQLRQELQNPSLGATEIKALKEKINQLPTITIPYYYITWVQSIITDTIEFVQSDMSLTQILTLVKHLYQNVPSQVKDRIYDILPDLPNLPKNGFTDLMEEVTFDYDLNNRFCNVTLLNLKPEKTEDEKDAGEKSATLDYGLSLQLFLFVGTYNTKVEEEFDEAEELTDEEEKPTADSENGKKTELDNNSPEENGDKKEEEEEEGRPALYFIVHLRGNLEVVFRLGKDHYLSISLNGDIGEDHKVEKKDDKGANGKASAEKPKEGAEKPQGNETNSLDSKDKKGSQPSEKALGFCLTAKDEENGDTSVFHGLGSTKCLSGRAVVKFSRNQGDIEKEPDAPKPDDAPEKTEGTKQDSAKSENNKDSESSEKSKENKNENILKLINTKYLDINIGNYPQVAYALYNYAYPKDVIDSLKLEKKDEQVDGFTAGYLGKLEDVEFILKLRQNEFFKSILKDDISAKFSLGILYDYKKGFKIGGDYSFHFDLDCNGKKLGKLTLQNLGIDIGSVKDDWGTLNLGLSSTFDVNLSAVAFSFENLGLGMNLNVVKPDFSIGDWDLGFNFKFPDGIGISIDTSVVKGSGMISYTESTGELFGALEIKVVKKFGVSALLIADLGTVPGHYFSMVALISTTFNPGIPLGMGFSLTGIGGCLGLMRQIDSQAVTTAVRNGTLNSIFFVEDLQNHLSEMKASALAIFPAKKDQFFVGLLAQISYAPVVSCNFGLMFQLPDPTSIIILGALKVSIQDTSVIRINVYFKGELDFEKGIGFDASLIDSEIVGIKLEGDMAFRLYWGGETKGFLLSIGGFHPAYTPEEGMQVANMKRLAMKLDYNVLKLGLETYLAITSNSFQIGAHLDIKVGWNKFGIFGYAGFDALFQFDPFLFMFDIEAGVAVKCGSWTLMSIDLALGVKGPAPWNAKGTAKFTFILIPIKVGFNITWGDKTPALPSKQIEILPLLVKEIDNVLNWSVNSDEQTDDEISVNMEKHGDNLLIQPFGTISFNQSAVPLELERPMDLCNNAVPADYNNLTITGYRLKGEICEKEEDEDNSNDFAPGLYYNLSIEEKLASPSYKKYHSGFHVNQADKRKTGEDIKEKERKYIIVVQKAGKTPEERNKEKQGAETNRAVSYSVNSEQSVKRYMKILDAWPDQQETIVRRKVSNVVKTLQTPTKKVVSALQNKKK